MEKQATLFAAFLVFSSVCFAAAPVLEVSPENLEFTASLGGANPENQVLSIWRGGGNGVLKWDVIEDCNWLSVEPNSGTSLGEVDDVNVSVDISELAEGLYNCELTVWADNAVNSPQIIDVELSITIAGDIDSDFDVDLYDYSALASAWLSEFGSPHWNPVCDITGDFFVDVSDLIVLVDNWLVGVSAGEVLMAGEAGTDTDGFVVITLTDEGDGSGWITVAYDATAAGPNFVRAFALDIVANDANIVEIDSLNADYWVYPGSIYIDANGEVNDFGSPVADPCVYPGTLGGLDTNGITIEMCALFEAGVDPEPAATGVLLRIRVDSYCPEVCVSTNATRGGVVMSDGSSMDPVVECVQIVGCDPPPPCPWDVDGNGWVNLNDRNAVITILNVFCSSLFCMGSCSTTTGWCYADPIYDVDGNGWVNRLDRDAIITYLNVNATAPFWSVPCP